MIINVDYDHIAKTKPHGPMLITGPRGSGKTSIGVKRAAFLLANYCLDSDDRIMFVNNSKSFTEHSSYLQKRIEEEKDKTLMDLVQVGQSSVRISSIDDLVYQHYREYCASNCLSFEISDEKNYYLDILYEGIDTLILEYPEVVYLDKKFKQFLLDEIEWIRACGYGDIQQYQNADRVGLQDFDGERPYKLNKNSKSRKAIFELMVYFTESCRSKGKIDYMEASIMALNSVKTGRGESYTHVVIDDCHELTKIQLDLIIMLYKPKAYSSITFLIEENPDCSPKSWLGQGRPFTTLGFDMTGRSKTLDMEQTDMHYGNRQISSRHNLDCSISYKEIDEPEKLFDFVITLFKENMTSEDFSLVFRNENTSIELNKSQNLLMIRRNNE
jgi:superfamily I DNA/RNA helicase